jgi:hypothetical protein
MPQSPLLCHCEEPRSGDEAIQGRHAPVRVALDCFASLAMTP